MGFRIKIAPGVRVSVHHHHIRTHIGPKIARVHVGSGRTGFSTGAGPLTLFGAIGTSRRSHRSPSSRNSGGGRAARPQYQLAERHESYQEDGTAEFPEASATAQVFADIETLLQQSFEPVQRPVVPLPEPIDEAEVRQRHKAEALKGLSILKRAERSQAKEQANLAADAEIAEDLRERELERARLQSEWDAVWELLRDNDPGLVLEVLAATFEDNENRAAAVSVNGSDVDLVVLVPGAEFIPERMPKITPSGRLSRPALTKTERCSYYNLMACGCLLNTVRQALAMAPGIMGVTAAVVRFAEPDAYGNAHLECLLAAHFTRARLANVAWEVASAVQIVNETAADLRVHPAGRTKELRPLDLSEEPDLKHLLEELDSSGQAPSFEQESRPECQEPTGLSKRAALDPHGARHHSLAELVQDLDPFRNDTYEWKTTVKDVIANIATVLHHLLQDQDGWALIITDLMYYRHVQLLANEDGSMYLETVSNENLVGSLTAAEEVALQQLGWQPPSQHENWCAYVEEPDPFEEASRICETLLLVLKLKADDLVSVTVFTIDGAEPDEPWPTE
jgi:hypothetical protein